MPLAPPVMTATLPVKSFMRCLPSVRAAHLIDLDRGVSTHNEDEARLNRKMCEVAERIIVVTDSSKFNRSSLHKIIDTQRIDMIIVDEGIPAESLDGLRKSGIDVVLVSPSP